jgi:hypothetical protein
LQSIETLLLVPVPVIDPARRMQLVETRRRIETNLHDGSTPMGSEPKPVQADKVKRRAEAILSAHGDAEWKQRVDREAQLPNLGKAVQPLRNDKLDLDATTTAAAAAAGHAKGIAGAAQPPAERPELRVAAERFSRVRGVADRPGHGTSRPQPADPLAFPSGGSGGPRRPRPLVRRGRQAGVRRHRRCLPESAASRWAATSGGRPRPPAIYG